jgi:hypothetical protein
MSLEKIVRILLPYKEISNSFSVALTKRNGFFVAEQFYKCREIFHEDFPITKNLLICVPSYKKNRIIKFFDFIENQLNIDNKSKIFITQRKNIYFVKLSKFWKTKIKFSLLTLLIRSALRIIKNLNLIKMLEKSFYLKKTINAFDLFFSGYTRYYGKKNSWYKEFNNKSAEDCKKLLKNK